MAGFFKPAICFDSYLRYVMNTYENAQRQLAELIARFEAAPASEQQQMECLRLKALKRMLVPSDQLPSIKSSAIIKNRYQNEPPSSRPRHLSPL